MISQSGIFHRVRIFHRVEVYRALSLLNEVIIQAEDMISVSS